MDPQFRVSSYHMNIGVGDSTIVVLTAMTAVGRMVTLNTVLIDGGFASTKQKGSIVKISNMLYTTIPYRFSSIGPTLLDSVVITHWHGDHYSGIIGLISADLQAQAAQKRFRLAAGQEATEAQMKGFIPTSAELEGLRCGFMKYDINGPQTVLYVPYSDPGVGQPRPSSPFDFKAGGTVNFNVWTDQHPLWVTDICRFESGTGILGTNVFNHNKTTSRGFDTPRDLANHHASTYRSGICPGLFVVAANGKVIETVREAAIGSSSSSSATFFAKVVEAPATNDPNSTSIICLIIFPDIPNTVAGSKVSHYLGGDAGHELETRVARWINGRVTAMKLSHHGSATSSPIALFNTFRPRTVVVSAADQYGHPSWQVLLWLAWWSQRQGHLADQFLWPMRYPYYIGADSKGKFTPFNNDVVDIRSRGEVTAFQQSLRDLVPDKFKATLELLIFDITMDEAEIKRWIMWWIYSRWQFMSPISNNSIYPPTGFTAGAAPYLFSSSSSSSSSQTPAREVHYVLIQSEFDNDLDGLAWGQMRDNPELLELHLTLRRLIRKKVVVSQLAVELRSQARKNRTRMAIARKQRGDGPMFTPRDIRINKLRKGRILKLKPGGRKGKLVAQAELVEPAMMGTDPVPDPGPAAPFELPPLPTGSYICSSDWAIASTSAGSITVLQKTDRLNDFLLDLGTGILMLEAAPIDGKISEGKFSQQDEWVAWTVQSLGVSSLNIAWDVAKVVSGFSLKFVSPWNLRFTTAAISPTFLRSQQHGIPKLGLYDPAAVMIFGLETPTTNVHATLKDVLDFIGYPESFLFGLASSAIRLQLDSDPNTRNAIWFSPEDNYETTIRLQFNVDPLDLSIITDFVSNTLKTGLVINDIKFIARKAVRNWDLVDDQAVDSNPELILSTTVAFNDNLGFMGYLISNPSYITIVLRPTGVDLAGILKWVVGLLDGDYGYIKDVAKWIPSDATNSIRITQVSIQVSPEGILGFSVDLEMVRTFGKGDSADNVAFLMSYVWRKVGGHEFVGSLLTAPEIDDSIRIPPEILPDFEDFRQLEPITTNPSPVLKLKNLLPNGQELNDPPAELDFGIDRATITLTDQEISFGGLIIRDDSKDTETLAFTIDLVELSASYNFESGDYEVLMSTRISLNDSLEGVPAILFATVRFDKAQKSWSLDGSIADLQVGSLFSFFPDSDANVVMDIMEHIELRSLNLNYIYTGGVGSSFMIEASLIIDVFELDMKFDRNSAGWNFSASLGAAPTATSSIKTILRSLVKDSGIADLIPPFADFKFSGGEIDSSPGEGATTKSGLSLLLNKSNGFLTFTLSLLLKGSGNNPTLRFTLLQIKRIGGPDDDFPIKRIIRISIESLPFGNVPKVPLVGQIQQPFDEVDYLWVHDSSDKGVTRGEAICINSIEQDFGLRFKEAKAEKDQKVDNIVLATGSHFIVIMRDPAQKAPPSVVLDYVFGRPTDPPNEDSGDGDTQEPGGGGTASGGKPFQKEPPNPEPAKGDTSMAKLQKTQGPLSISNFGLRYSNSTLYILFDATVKLGPLEFKLLGFGLTLTFTEGINLRSLASARPGVDLSGLAVAFDKPPTLIEGMFKKESTAEIEKFSGGVVLTMAPYSFLAVGSYGEIKSTGNRFVFIFGKLNGPLISLAFAEINGISLGFGYNTRLRLPTLVDVDQFPFLNKTSGSAGGTSDSDPLGILTALTGTDWITIHEGSFWIAAGLEARAFQCLDIEAVVTFQFEPEVTLGIIAKAIATVPVLEKPDPSKSFVYAEIGIVATLSMQAGVMRVEAKLSPNSFVLNPACHLRGGFALCYWFAGSGHEGDWVFTIGGYHPAYTPPAHYPVPERLSISWVLNDYLSVTGEAYFAITPKVCMGGGSLSVVFSLSPLYAYFHAYADFLINYSPFHFLGQVGVSVGVHFTIDLWICTIDIHVDISASLDLYGPPFGGVVHVDFYVFGFSIHFGDQESVNEAITLSEFWNLVQQSDTSVKSTAAIAGATPNSPEKPKSQHVLSVVTGRYAGKAKNVETPEGAPWIVRRGGFKFSVQSQFAIGSILCNGAEVVNYQERIYAKPMHLVAGDDGGQWIESIMTITISEGDIPVSGFKCASIVKKVPSALWGKYIPSEDPRNAGNSVKGLLTKNDDLTIDLMMGIDATAPPPFLSQDLVKPFEAAQAMSTDVFVENEVDGFHPELPVTPLPVVDGGPWRPQPLETLADKPARPWEKAREVWEGAKAADTLKALVDVCGKGFGWTLDLTSVAKVPDLVVKGLETEYLLPPFIGIDIVV